MGSGLWIYLLEAGVALALLAFIVWWTLPKAPKNDEQDPERSRQGNGPPAR